MSSSEGVRRVHLHRTLRDRRRADGARLTALPLARVTVKRQRESELRKALREMRTAIDKFKDMADTQIISPMEVSFGSEGYPKTLTQLVEGVAGNNDASGTKIKFLRRIPVDPMTGEAEWGMRSYQDRPDASVWGGQNVHDVRSRRAWRSTAPNTRTGNASRLCSSRASSPAVRSRVDADRVAGRPLADHDPRVAGDEQLPDVDPDRRRSHAGNPISTGWDAIDRATTRTRPVQPASIQALVTDGYLRAIPMDTITKSTETWTTVPAEPDPSKPTADPGIYDVKSGSEAVAMNGTRYADW